MEFADWCLLLGGLALTSALLSAYLRSLPLSEPLLYLLAGLALGWLGGLRLDLPANAHWLERVTEVVVIVSLFVSGLKLRLPLGHRAWRAAYRLALPAMLLCIAGVALVGHLVLGLTLATALLLGAILAPTDPVLADEFAVGDARDRDRLRYGLSGEAGLNDGMAFPFVVLGLLLIQNEGQWGAWLGGWAAERILWAIPAGLLLGFGLGYGTGRAAVWIRRRAGLGEVTSDLLLIALIGVSYGLAEGLHAWGFLSVFAAGLGLRRAEVHLSRGAEPPPRLVGEPPAGPALPAERGAEPALPAEHLIEPEIRPEALRDRRVASGLVLREVISFGEALERLFVLGSVLLVGLLLAEAWDWRGVWLGLALFAVIRPLSVGLTLPGTPTTGVQRLLMGWFGVRGVGSLYYLCYAIGEGTGPLRAEELSGLILTVIGLSIVLHGVSATPLLRLYERNLPPRPAPPDEPRFGRE